MENKEPTLSAPLHLDDGTGVDMYFEYIGKNIIPQMIQIIEDSGLSFRDARLIPDLLKRAIIYKEETFLQSNRFTDCHSEELLSDSGRERLL